MKKYESIFILNDRKCEDGGKAYAKKVEEILAEVGATNVTSESMGRKQFARPIGKRTSGLYWSFIFELAADKVVEFQDKFRLEEVVLRQVVYTYDKPENAVTLDLSSH